MPAVNIPNVGTVNFPDSMSQAEITQAIQTNILPKYGMQTPQPNTLLDRIKSNAGAQVQGAAQGLSNLATGVYNVGAAVDRSVGLNAPAGVAPNFEGAAAQAHPTEAMIAGMAPYAALPAARVAEGAGLVGRLAANAMTGGTYGGLLANANPNATGSDIASGAGLGAIAGAAIPEALSTPFKVGNLIAKPIAMALGRIQKGAERDMQAGIGDRNATPAEAGQNYQNMQEMGVTQPTLGSVTNSPTASAMTEYSTIAPMTGQKQALRQTLAQGDNAAQHVFNDLSGGRNFGELEQGALKDLTGILEDNKGFSAGAYDSLSNIAGKMTALPGTDPTIASAAINLGKNNAISKASSILDNIVTSRKSNLLSGQVENSKVMETLRRISTPYNTEELGRPLQLSDLIFDRSKVGELLGNEGIPSDETRVLKPLYASFTNDIESSLDNKPLPQNLKEQWANDFTNKLNNITSTASNAENAAKLQTEGLAIKNKILGNDSATLKDIWQAANDWHRENVAPLQGEDVQYHSYQGLSNKIANTLMSEQNQKAYSLLPQATRKSLVAVKLKNAVQDIQPGEDGTQQGIVGLARLARQYKTLNVKNNLDDQLQGLSYRNPAGQTIPLTTTLKNIVKLNDAVKDLRPVVKSPLTGYSLKGSLGGLGTAALGAMTGGPLGALTATAGTSITGRLVGNLMRHPALIKAYANPQQRMQIIQNMLKLGPMMRGANAIQRAPIAAPAAYMTAQPQNQ